jgi:L-asparaginase
MLQESPILVLTTGGTIDKQYFDALSRYQITDTMVGQLLATARVMRPFVIEELLRKDSLELTEADRTQIVDRVSRASQPGVVITHGTDTMIQTAAALSVLADKTIVLTGALAPARFSDSDATFNLGMAFATVQCAPPGIYITMNGTVFSADNVMKDREHGCFRRRSDVTEPGQ